MQTSVIVIFIIFIVIAVYCYYAGFIKRDPYTYWFAQSGFVFSTFLMIPFLIIILWLQSTATDRLTKKAGIIPHPSIVESVGIAIGIGNNPTWVFKVKASPEEIMAFYRNENNRPGWILVSDNKIVKMLVLKGDKKGMSISTFEDRTSRKVIYTLTKNSNQRNEENFHP